MLLVSMEEYPCTWKKREDSFVGEALGIAAYLHALKVSGAL
jgi:hypothetical protein